MDVTSAGSLLSKRKKCGINEADKPKHKKATPPRPTPGNFPQALTIFELTDEMVDGFVCELLQGRCFNCQSRSEPASNALCVPIPGTSIKASLSVCRLCARLLSAAIMGRNVVKLNSMFSTSLKAGCSRPTVGQLFAGACAVHLPPPQASNGADSGSPNRKLKASQQLFMQFLKHKHGRLLADLRLEATHALLTGTSVGRCLVWAYVS